MNAQQKENTAQGGTLNAGWLKRTLVWMGRIGRCRGFGVQSPWAYSMVRYVINERYPYYAYEPLAAKFAGQSHIKRKLGELYLRLANSVQPATVVDFCGEDDAFWAYISAGCRKAKHVNGKTGQAAMPKEGVALVRLRADESLPIYINKVRHKAKDGWVVIIEDIHGNAKVRKQWCEWVERSENITSFDLYYCGLVFFDSKRYKQKYIINF